MRSLLYVPADNVRFIAKAHERGADCIILDLEDSVCDAAKADARQNLAVNVRSLRRGPSRVAVRINAGNAGDVGAALSAGVDYLVVPKVNDVSDLQALAAILPAGEGSYIPVLATIESPTGVLAAPEIARHPLVTGLLTGSEDLALALGAVPDPDVLRLPKLLVHYAAKAAGKLSFGLLRSIADYADVDAIAEAAQEARRHGFDGATCIHPSAVAILNAAFCPSDADLAWARAVMATKGTASLNGQMIDKPLRERAVQILRSAKGNPSR